MRYIALFAAALVVGAAPAQAADFTFTASGTIDKVNPFYATPYFKAGDAFSLNLTIETYTQTVGADYSYYGFKTTGSFSAGSYSTTLTHNNFFPNYMAGEADWQQDGDMFFRFQAAHSTSSKISNDPFTNSVFFEVAGITDPGSGLTPLTIGNSGMTSSNLPGGTFRIGARNDDYQTRWDSSAKDFTWSLVPLKSAVPEPGTWAFMILGFGAVGFSLRTRRRSSLA